MSKALIFFIAGALQLGAQSNSPASPGGTAGSTTGGTTSPSAPARIPTPTSPSATQNPSTPTVQTPARPIFISGKVMMEDGMPVPSNVVIQRICSGSPHAVAYTDSKGRFNFQWNQLNSAIFMDASESAGGYRDGSGNSGFGAMSAGSGVRGAGGDSAGPSMSGCELQASLAGYRSDAVHLYNHNPTDNPDVGMIVLHRLSNGEAPSVSATTLGAPKDARKAFDRAQQAVAKGKPDDAVKEFDKAIALYPKFADAWVALGKLRLQQKSLDGAREAFLKSVEADPKLAFPYIELGLMSADKGEWADTAAYLDRATKLDSMDYPKAWYVDAVANYNLKRFDAAEKSAREAVKLDPKHVNPRSGYLLGLILAEKHDYNGAAEQLKSYMTLLPNAPDMPLVKKQLVQLEGFMAEAQPPAGAGTEVEVKE